LSDHGELLGDKGLWTKQVMYEPSAGIPLILSGPGVPQGETCDTAASVVDIAATALDVMLDTSDAGLPGLSLRTLARAPGDPDRTVLSEYHDGGSTTGAFMVRWGDWKYVCYPGMPPQLFNLAEDPSEDHDLGTDMSARAVAAREAEVEAAKAQAEAMAAAEKMARERAEAAEAASEAFPAVRRMGCSRPPIVARGREVRRVAHRWRRRRLAALSPPRLPASVVRARRPRSTARLPRWELVAQRTVPVE
ncbi:MAG: sulfatase/phosphatase domain-containing protein, partial [Pseudomonadota bacterium]|nr:sulfatase/phosphatase domain-containing protein [Pseudomonadota bacterium]